jgi:type I restriction enzyme S subunit
MLDALKPYPEYKAANLPWVREVPSHWSVSAVKRAFEVQLGKMLQNQAGIGDLLVPYFKAQHVQWSGVRTVKLPQMWASQRDLSRYGVRHGDLLVCEGGEGGRCGIVQRPPPNAVIQNALHRVRPRMDDRVEYLSLVMSCVSSSGWFDALNNKATIAHFTGEKFGALAIPLPPPAEQAGIVRFLGAVDRKVNRFIRAKRRLIEVLTEQKQAIITHAVTRGLNPDAPRKPSGIDWLGDVPEHWEVAALRLRYDQCLGKMLDAKRITGAHLVSYLRNTDVQWDQINTDDLPQMDIEPHELRRFTVQPGDLLVCEGGDVGRCAFWEGQMEVCGFQKAIHRLRPLKPEREYPRFLFYLMFLASKLGIFVAGGSESTIAHLTGDKLRAHRFVFPPRAEQKAIAAYLDDELRTLEGTVQVIRREIDLIREYRTRLVADVVTGKLDVRGHPWAKEAAAPAGADEAESIPEDAGMDGEGAAESEEVMEEAADVAD